MERIKQDFPLLSQRKINDQPIAYLDNAATTQKPKLVTAAIQRYYDTMTSNPHRGAYTISQEATDAYEGVRAQTAKFIGAPSAEEIVFTAGTTEALNLISLSYGMTQVGEGDEILLSVAEHHSNLIPWQRVAKCRGATLRYLYPDSNGRLDIAQVKESLTERTKILGVAHISNVLGMVNPIKEMAALAHAVGAVIVVDAAQSAPHMRLDVQDMDVDFLAFSGHKMLGPAGIGVLYGKKALLDAMEPLMLGGGIVEEVTEQSARFLEAPWKFEAGSPNVESVIGLGAAMEYLDAVGFATIQKEQQELTAYALEQMRKLPEVQIYGDANSSDRAGIIAFNVKGVHPHDTASILDAFGIAVRAGHHCAQPLMKHLGVTATCRMSLYFYNTKEEIDRFAAAVPQIREVLGLGSA